MSRRSSAATDPLKLWIMTALAEDRRGFEQLGLSNADRVMNMSFPHVPRSDLLDATLELFEEGLIFAVVRGRRAQPDRLRLSRWLFPARWRRRVPYGGLTRAGGSIWEQACRASWRRFFTNSMIRWKCTDDGALGDCTVNFEGASAERLRLYSMGYAGGDKDFGAFRWRRFAPWKATYWKTLPEGFRLTCDFKKRDYDPLRAKFVGPLRDLDKWHEDPPRVYDRGHRISLRPCGESLLRLP